MTRVVNLHHDPRYDVYIGRTGRGFDGYFGNPVLPGERCKRCDRIHYAPAQTLRCFEQYMLERMANDPEYLERVRGLRGKVLGCFCVPSPCHGQVYVSWLEKNT